MEHRVQITRTQIPQARRIAWDAFGNPIRARTGRAIRPQPLPALTDPQGQAVARAKFRMMAMGTGYIAIARQDRIIKQRLPQCGLCYVKFDEILVRQRRW